MLCLVMDETQSLEVFYDYFQAIIFPDFLNMILSSPHLNKLLSYLASKKKLEMPWSAFHWIICLDGVGKKRNRPATVQNCFP